MGRAVEELEESAFSEDELLSYEHFWDMIGASELLMEGSVKRGLEEGFEKGFEKGIAEGEEKGRKQERISNAAAMMAAGIPAEKVAEIMGLDIEEVDILLKRQAPSGVV